MVLVMGLDVQLKHEAKERERSQSSYRLHLENLAPE